MADSAAVALLEEIDLGSARGAKRPQREYDVTIVRPLTEADLPVLAIPPTVGDGHGLLSHIRHSHHQLAQLIAQGVEQAEASLITGYSPSYISFLTTGDPMFRELVQTYATERRAVFVDVLERMRTLGLSTLDELQARLEEAPEKWSRRELMEMAQLMLGPHGASGKTASSGGSGGPAVSLEVKFITAAPTVQPSPPVVDAVDLAWKDTGQ